METGAHGTSIDHVPWTLIDLTATWSASESVRDESLCFVERENAGSMLFRETYHAARHPFIRHRHSDTRNSIGEGVCGCVRVRACVLCSVACVRMYFARPVCASARGLYVRGREGKKKPSPLNTSFPEDDHVLSRVLFASPSDSRLCGHFSHSLRTATYGVA
eukprot:Opistho-2@80648